MPTFRHGKRTVILMDGTNMSPYLNDSTTANELEALETTTYGSDDKTYIVGLGDGTLQMGGLFDGAASASDGVLSGSVFAVEDVALTVMWDGAALGSRAAVIPAGQLTSYEVSSPVADVVSISAAVQADGGVQRGVVLASLSAIAASASATSVDNGAASANGATATLHVTANNRDGTATVKVQHSSDDNVWVDFITFDAVSASTTDGQGASATGTVNRYLRAINTLAGSSGSVTYTVAAARR
jgi:hypothetical protein